MVAPSVDAGVPFLNRNELRVRYHANCGEAKVRLRVDTVTVKAADKRGHVRATSCGEPAAISATASEAI